MKKADGYLAIITFVITLMFGVEVGILTGISLSVVAIMYRISRPNVAILGNLPGTRSFRDITLHEEAEEIEGILILRVDASFMFANADFLKDVILSQSNTAKSDIKAVIIDASSVNDLDTTAIQALYAVVDILERRNVDLYFTGVHGAVVGLVQKSGLIEKLGQDHFLLSPFRAVQQIQNSEDVDASGDGALEEDSPSLGKAYS